MGDKYTGYEYIEKKSFIEWVEETYCKPCEAEGRDYNHCRCGACQYDDMMRDVECFADADVAPIIHAKWVDTDPETPDRAYTKNGMAYYCSACGHPAGKHKHKTYKHCPWCGALMDGGVK